MRRASLVFCLSAVMCMAALPQARTTEDTLQDDHIDEINRHLEHTDQAVDEQRRQIDESAVSVAGMRSDVAAMRRDLDGTEDENRWWFGGIISAIAGGTLTIRTARKKPE